MPSYLKSKIDKTKSTLKQKMLAKFCEYAHVTPDTFLVVFLRLFSQS